jgi:hypothetical protein
VNFDWLSGHPVLLFLFILAVLGVPSTLAANWQLVRSGIRRLRREKTTIAVAAVSEDDAVTAPRLTRYFPPVHHPPMRYHNNGAAQSTEAYVDADSYRAYMESVTSGRVIGQPGVWRGIIPTTSSNTATLLVESDTTAGTTATV